MNIDRTGSNSGRSDGGRSNGGNGRDLSVPMIRENLSCLGKHPFALSHAYLAFSAIGENIRSIECIENYPNLMYINLSDNVIENLKPLENLPALVQIKARNNHLKDCLAFSPKKCSLDNAWPTGEKSVGSMLAMADLTGNQISDIGDLQHHNFLECLILSSNKITKISGLQSLKYLQVLDLSYNKLTEINTLEGLLINELNLEGNEITSLKGLTTNPRLSVLNVSKNKILSLEPLSSCLQLHNLDVSGNGIQSIRQVESLVGLMWLKLLNLSSNPCCGKSCYRARVVYRLPSLQRLDDTTISSEEKIRANNLYSSDGGDLQLRREVLSKYYPEESFMDFSPSFEDDELDLQLAELHMDSIDGLEPLIKRAISKEDYKLVKSASVGVLLDVIGSVHGSMSSKD